MKSPFWYIKPSLGGYLLPKPLIAKVMIMKYANNYPNVFHLISWKIEHMERNEQDYGARSDFKQARWIWMKFFVTNEKWMKSECSWITSTNEELYYANYDMKDFFIF